MFEKVFYTIFKDRILIYGFEKVYQQKIMKIFNFSDVSEAFQVFIKKNVYNFFNCIKNKIRSTQF